MQQVNLAAKLATFTEYWQPRTVTQFNGHDVMVVKAQGEFVWHTHDDTDDFFLVLQGHLTIELRDRSIQLGPGELFVVPKGVEHRPVSTSLAHRAHRDAEYRQHRDGGSASRHLAAQPVLDRR